MTQSGQGEEPSARPAREGIVLPSDGGEPLLPGQMGGANRSAVPPVGPGPAPTGGTGGHAGPASGQAWGQPWGPGQQAQAQPPAQTWDNGAGQQWSAPEQPGSAPGSAPAQDWGTPGAQPSWQSSDPQSGWGGQQPQAQPLPPHAPPGSGLPAPQGAGPLPPEGAQTSAYGLAGQPAPQGAHRPQQGAHPLPHATQAAPLPSATSTAPLPTAAGAPLPPAVDEGATQYIAPVAPVAAADEGATQYIAPMAAADEGATQYIAPIAAADEGATQYIPPVAPGALPPETAGDEATRFLGRAAVAAPGAAGPDAQATQYLPPMPGQPGPAPYAAAPGATGGDRQPPAEFENLFRDDAGSGAASTQYLPRFDAEGAPGAPAGRALGPYDDHGDDHGHGGRGRPRVPLIAAVGIGIVVLGIGAGALLSGSDGKSADGSPVSATGAATDSSSSASADPARQQAVALDKLLADSGNSRGAVIKAVADVKACQNLGQATTTLRDAAKQRDDLVTQLSGLAVDKLPNHAALNAALTSAWHASASADAHYAAWADQVSGDKGCRKGHARSTGQTAAGNRASGTASAQKVRAASLWNVIAQKYGLTERQPTQL